MNLRCKTTGGLETYRWDENAVRAVRQVAAATNPTPSAMPRKRPRTLMNTGSAFPSVAAKRPIPGQLSLTLSLYRRGITPEEHAKILAVTKHRDFRMFLELL